ncbi:hypothetical protein [Serratia plymuthica]|uniref:Cytoplasmic protein n=1 Tax=Serratia plymuthica S13 TaxID=1348660 RepID=S4YIY3_SERPL|nr:hypothetical protein [Serratia plymuthica]AGP44639.1 hypothetical protein M621_13260 [Serratia plymuthica S13]ANJ95739.1 hypothetical protein ADP72_23205 [Serratia plymuthica]ANJ98816.1 hypothetical protein ADP73_13045 [Serratia plymuthica]EKF64248.1 hypothetical protein B194_2782 [Serratia plymuthica A30]KYG14158.1 hypothetical protein SOD10_45720 [Serratia plymuthica]
MEKHYVLDIQHAGKAFARMQMFTPWAADQLQQAMALFPTEQGYQLHISQVKERRIVYQSGASGITVLGDALELAPYHHPSEVEQ